MSEHKATITWRRESAPFDYESYPRNHTWSFGVVEIQASSAPEFLGSAELVDPEQAYVASLSSCHMLTFLAIAARRKFVVENYVDEAVGFLQENKSGRLAITRVVLKPEIKFAAGAEPNQEQLEKLHRGAHKHCFIANSVKTDIEVEV